MFDLTNTQENPIILSSTNILKRVSEYQIYQYYLPDLSIGGRCNSPFRKDNNPSFGIFIGKYGDLAYNDYKLGGGNVFSFVMKIEQVDYYTALIIVNEIFELNLLVLRNKILQKNYTKVKPDGNKKKLKKNKPKFSIKSRGWKQEDIDYFHPLDYKKLGFIPIQFYWIDEQLFNTSKLAYAIRYGKNIYKIYQPLLETNNGKWWTNIDSTVEWYGHNRLPKTGDLLFVVSSAKDCEVLFQLNYNVIAPHTEAQMFSVEQYTEYSKRFKRIVIFYDNDETGILKATKFSERYNLDYIYLPEEETKDPFEFIKEYSMRELHEFIEEYI